MKDCTKENLLAAGSEFLQLIGNVLCDDRNQASVRRICHALLDALPEASEEADSVVAEELAAEESAVEELAAGVAEEAVHPQPEIAVKANSGEAAPLDEVVAEDLGLETAAAGTLAGTLADKVAVVADVLSADEAVQLLDIGGGAATSTRAPIASEPTDRELQVPEEWSDPPEFNWSETCERLRLKSDACRWALERKRLLDSGEDFRISIEPNDKEIIARAKKNRQLLSVDESIGLSWTRAS